MALRGWGRAERREGLPVVGDEPTITRKKNKKNPHILLATLKQYGIQPAYEVHTILPEKYG